MSNNVSAVSDPRGKFEDWVELYNLTSSPISTSALFLTDTIGLLHKWKFPNYLIPANGYAIIWADEDGSQGDMHANFQLSNIGEPLILTTEDSLVIDSMTYLTQADDVSFGRSPNGIGSFTMLTPTFNANNDFLSSTQEIRDIVVVYPNPFTDVLYLNENEEIEIRDILGKLIYNSSEASKVQTLDWNPGVYFIYLKSKKQTLKVIKI